MNPTTQQPNTQAPQQPILPSDQAGAHLGFITNMHEQLLQHKAKKAGVTAPQEPQNAPGQAQPQEDVKSLESKLMGEIGQIKEMLAPKDKDKEIEDLKKEIEKVLNEHE